MVFQLRTSHFALLYVRYTAKNAELIGPGFGVRCERVRSYQTDGWNG